MKSAFFANGRFWNPAREGRPDAGSLLARGGRIAALDADAEAAGAGTKVVDLQGRTAMPGPVDAHCHLVSYGMGRIREADLRGATSLADLGERLERHRQALGIHPGDGRWLLGRGFEQDRLAEQRWPTRADLDRIAPEIPVRITRICGHALAANSAALRAAGCSDGVASEGFPPGVLTETAMAPIHAAVPAPGPREWRLAAAQACGAAARAGFVGIHSLMAHAPEIRALTELRAAGPLPVRVRMQLPFERLETYAEAGLRTGFGDEYLSLGAVKLFSDGSLGARTAALLAPYEDEPTSSGELIYAPDELTRRVQQVYRSGFQVCVHAIGDRALEVTLAAMAAARETEGAPVLPPRVEHASLVNPALVQEMLRVGAGAAVQPQFAHSDYWTPDRLGRERTRGAYAWRTLLEAGVPLAGSTDCPVEALDAPAAIAAAVHRPEWSREEALSVAEAVRMFSEGSYALGGFPAPEGPRTGRLEAGQFADFVVLAEDPRRVPPAELAQVPVVMTVVGGQVVYRTA
jgi:predicted amidohydrolase YtcJ